MTRVFTPDEYYKRLNKIKEDHSWIVNKSKFTIFVGAGFSQNFGMPGWNSYAYKKLDLVSKDLDLNFNYSTIEELKQLDKKHLLTLIDSYITQRSNIERIKYEKEIFKIKYEQIQDFRQKHATFYEKFKKINASFVTTNYDNVLEEYFGFIKKDNLELNEDYVLNPREVFHIHGDIASLLDESFLISTWLDYYDLYFEKKHIDPSKNNHINKINQFLDNLFEKNEILIIGYSLSEIEILKFIFNNIRDKDDSSNITILVLKREKTDKKVLHQLYQELGLNIICLDIDEKGYSVLFDFLEELSKEFSIDEVNYNFNIL